MSLPFVIDASLALNWCFEDEVTLDTERVMSSLETTYAIAPSFFALELQNGLWMAERRSRITAPQSNEIWRRLQVFDIRLASSTTLSKRAILVELARISGLAVYDAAYLELAEQTGLPLATLDEKLCKAAVARQVVLLP